MKSLIKQFIQQFIIEQKLFYRNPISVFWTYLFPLFIMLIIGWFFNTPISSSKEQNSIIIIDKLKSKLSETLIKQISKNFTVKKISPSEKNNIMQNYKQSNIFPKITSQAKEENTLIIIEGSTNNLNIKLYLKPNYSKSKLNTLYKIAYNINNTAPKINIELVENNKNDGLRYSDFLAPGMIAMSIMSTCIFGVGISLTSYREKGNLRRLALTPLRRSLFILAHVLHRYTVILLQSAILLVSANIFFSLEIKGDIISLLIIITVGLLTFISIGFIIASRTNKVESANALSNILFYPLLLLGSVYFSLDRIPSILHPIAKLTPLLHLTEALRKVINYGLPFYELSYNLLVLFITMLLCFFISVKLFRWE